MTLIPTTVKTSAYTASPNDFVPVDASGGSVTITLPNAPADQSQVGIETIAIAGSNVVTAASSGSDVFNKTGGPTSLDLSSLDQGAFLQYQASTKIWYIQAGNLPLNVARGAAKLGGDGTLGGAGGSALSGLIVTNSSGQALNPIPGVVPAVNPLDPAYGGNADARVVTDAAITAGQSALSSAQAGFTSADVGKAVIIPGLGGIAGGHLVLTGGPTGGTFTLSFVYNGLTYTTANINWNDSASTVQTRLLQATRSGGTQFQADTGSGAISCSGGPLPGTTISISSAWSWYASAFTSALTGGSGPSVSSQAASTPLTTTISSVAGGVATLANLAGGTMTSGAIHNSTIPVSVVYGTKNAPAITSALATGSRTHLPAGSYVWDAEVVPTGTLHLTGDGVGRTIVYVAGVPLGVVPTGAGLVGTQYSVSGAVSQNAMSLTLSSAPTGINPGDYVFLSDASWIYGDASSNGEFLRVLAVSGSTVYFYSGVVSDNAGPGNVAYTSGNAKLQKMSFGTGVVVEGIEFRNTGEIITGKGINGPGTQVAWASGTGIQIYNCLNPIVRSIKFSGHGQDAVLFQNCIFARCDDSEFRDGANSLGPSSFSPPVSYGYGVAFYGSQWCKVSRCTGESLPALANTSGSANPIPMPSWLCDAEHCVARNGQRSQFLNHPSSGYCNHIDCTVIGTPQWYVDTLGHPVGFDLAGHYCKAIRPLSIGVPAANGGGVVNLAGVGCEAINPVIRNVLQLGNGTPAGIYVGATGCKVHGADIDTVLSGGHGIYLAQPDTEITNAIIRNCGGYAISCSTTPNSIWSGVVAVSCTSGLTNTPVGLITQGSPASSGTAGMAAEAFSVYLNSAFSSASGVVIPFDAADFDVSSRVDLSTNKGRYTPKTAGYYRLSAAAQISDALGSTDYFILSLRKNGSAIKTAIEGGATSAGTVWVAIEALVQANGTSDYFEISFTSTLATSHFYSGSAATYFCGELIGRS